MLGGHVYQNGDNLINLTTRKSLPVTSGATTLKQHLFLAGQETEAIQSALFNRDNLSRLFITIIPTWRCNLRCSHCFVMHKLKKSGDCQINVDKLYAFINKLKSIHKKLEQINMIFVGGEATLNTSLCLEVIKKAPTDLKYHFDMTSNGTILNEQVLELYSRLDSFMISIDGTQRTHNAQRKPLDQIDDPYTTTLNNIKRLVHYGLRDRLKVQSALPSTIADPQVGRIFYKEMLMAGVKFEQILYGTTTPTNVNPTFDPKMITKTMSKAIFPQPCCKFRLDSNYVIDDQDTVYTDYFQNSDYSYLGTLDDDINTIHENHFKNILSDIPVLNDDKCKVCPVVGVCWGWCANTHKHLKPSDYCSQEAIHTLVKNAAAKGLLETISPKNKMEFTQAE